VVSFDLELEVSLESANATDTPPKSIAIPKDKAAVCSEYLINEVFSSAINDNFQTKTVFAR